MRKPARIFVFFTVTALIAACSVAAYAAPRATAVSGEILRITLDPPSGPNDIWMGGRIDVGGQSVIIPRNLLIDLPANRLTLKQIFDQAPSECVAVGQSGLAKADTCINTGGRPAGFATISANVMDNNNVIAGDVFIEKGKEIVTGKITFINYAAGWLRVNGRLNNSSTGTMIRLNDPTGRHTVQRGYGCAAAGGGTSNCSPDPRFTLDPDNYTAAFVTGYPVCIPSTFTRRFSDVLDLNTNGNTSEALLAQAAADGTGDLLCPDTNRTVNGGKPVADSRRFAPIKLGDNITAEGNFEVVNGAMFLSAHTFSVADGLTTRTDDPNQPDYMFIEEAIMDVPGFNNARARSLFIGFTTVSPADVLLWTIHRDPKTNAAHEFPLGSVRGCEGIGGPGTCASQGITPGASDIFKIRYDVDFIRGAAKPEMGPCAVINQDGRLPAVCLGGGTTAEMFGILSPIPREIQARTGRKMANPTMMTLDFRGREATNGQYLFPFGINLGGLEVPNFFEIDLNRINTPTIFEGLPWLMDRRVSPGGCDEGTGCEATRQPANPFPISGLDPRTAEPSMPTGSYNDPVYTSGSLLNVRDRTLSFVDEVGGGNFNFRGDNSVFPYPPATPPAKVIPVVLPVPLTCTMP